MSHLCDSTVAGPTARRDNVLASKCEYPPFRYPPFKCALKRGVELKGGSLHDGYGGFDGFGGSGEHITLLLLVLENTAQWGDRGGFDGFGGFGGNGGFGHDGYPLKLNPLFRGSEIISSAKWPGRSAMWIFQPEFWGEFCDLNFRKWISRGWIFQGASFAGKQSVKKFDPRIRVQNSGVQNSFPRIRPQIRVPEAQNPLCRPLSLIFHVTEMRFSKK